MRQVALGQWPEMGYAAALGVWDELRRRRDAGEDLAKEKKRSNVLAKAKAAEKESHGAYTVRRLIEDYLDGPIKGRKQKGQDETQCLMLGGDTSAILAKQPQQITCAQAFALLEKLGVRAPVLANTLRMAGRGVGLCAQCVIYPAGDAQLVAADPAWQVPQPGQDGHSWR